LLACLLACFRKNHAGFIPLRNERGREFQKVEAYRWHEKEKDKKVVEKEMKTA
jgi:uroporphyrinogen-III synthase